MPRGERRGRRGGRRRGRRGDTPSHPMEWDRLLQHLLRRERMAGAALRGGCIVRQPGGWMGRRVGGQVVEWVDRGDMENKSLCVSGKPGREVGLGGWLSWESKAISIGRRHVTSRPGTYIGRRASIEGRTGSMRCFKQSPSSTQIRNRIGKHHSPRLGELRPTGL
jgi:hypothetical protein